MTRSADRPLGWWLPQATPTGGADNLRLRLLDLSRSSLIAQAPDGLTICENGTIHLSPDMGGLPILTALPSHHPTTFGDPTFRRDHQVRYAYVSGSMANGIASVEVVEAMAKADLLGFFGAAGLGIPTIDAALTRLRNSLGTRTFGANLIHSPNEPDHEAATVELFLKHGLCLIEASAFLDLTLPVVRWRTAGIRRGADGRIETPNRVMAKVSRVEVATKFLSPPPEKFLLELQRRGHLSGEQVELAKRVPLADDLTVEADSGGHTDNRPLVTLLPTMIALRDRLQAQFDYPTAPRIGAAGGIATPQSVAAAFAMGAAYVVTGSINQACVESGSCDAVRAMLAQAEQADIAMAPAADMFEMGVKVQVLKRGTMFAMRAAKLYEVYRACTGIDAIPPTERANLEKNLFRIPLDQVWQQTREYFLKRDPTQVTRAEADPKHRMALVFRWYLGQSSRWANAGVPDRTLDYQVWCGPAMGAFNEWTRGTFLAEPGNRSVVTVALNLLYNAGLVMRGQHLRQAGIAVPADWLMPRPLERAEVDRRLAGDFAS